MSLAGTRYLAPVYVACQYIDMYIGGCCVPVCLSLSCVDTDVDDLLVCYI